MSSSQATANVQTGNLTANQFAHASQPTNDPKPQKVSRYQDVVLEKVFNAGDLAIGMLPEKMQDRNKLKTIAKGVAYVGAGFVAAATLAWVMRAVGRQVPANHFPVVCRSASHARTSPIGTIAADFDLAFRNQSSVTRYADPEIFKQLEQDVEQLPFLSKETKEILSFAPTDTGDSIVNLYDAYVLISRDLAPQWNNLTRTDQDRAGDLLSNIARDLAEQTAACFSVNPQVQARLADLFEIPYLPSNTTVSSQDLYSAFNQVRALNLGTPQLLNDDDFKEVCKEFIDIAKDRNGQTALVKESDGRYQLAKVNLKPFVNYAAKIAWPYTNVIEHPPFRDLAARANELNIGAENLESFVKAPIVDQVEALKDLREAAALRYLEEKETLSREDVYKYWKFAYDTQESLKQVLTAFVTGKSYYLAYNYPDGKPRSKINAPMPGEWVACFYLNLFYWGSNGQSVNQFMLCWDAVKDYKDSQPEIYTPDFLNEAQFVSLEFAEYLNGKPCVVSDTDKYDMHGAIEIMKKGF